MRSLEQFIQTVKGQPNFGEQNAFLTCMKSKKTIEIIEIKYQKILMHISHLPQLNALQSTISYGEGMAKMCFSCCYFGQFGLLFLC